MSGAVRLLAVVTAGLVFAGCGSNAQPSASNPPPDAAQSADQTTPPPEPTSDPSTQSYPTLHFKQNGYPYTAQLVDITTDNNGLPGAIPAPPGHTYVIVRLDFANASTDRGAPEVGNIGLDCSGLGHVTTGYWEGGYDNGSDQAPGTQGAMIWNGPDPNLWEEQFLVSEGVDTIAIHCRLGADADLGNEARFDFQGTNKLN